MLSYKVAAMCQNGISENLLIARPKTDNQPQLLIESIYTCELNEAKEIFQSEKVNLLSYVRTGADEIIDVIPTTLSNQSIYNYAKNNLGISSDENFIDVFNFTDSCILCSLSRTKAERAARGLSSIYSGNLIFSQQEVAMVNFYLLNYNNTNLRTGLVTFINQYISLTVVKDSSVIFSANVHVNPGENVVDTMLKLLSDVSGAIRNFDSSFEYDFVLLAGDCDSVFIDAIKGAGPATTVNFFNPLNANLVSLENLSLDEQNVFRLESHRFAPIVAAAFITAQYKGVDLAGNFSLKKDFTSDISFYTPQTITAKVFDFASRAAAVARSATVNQTRIIALAVILNILYVSYQYISLSNENKSLNSQLSSEQKHLASLKEVKSKLHEYEAKLKVQNDRVKAIENIQLVQNTIPTILYTLEQAGNPLHGLMTIENLKVENRAINILATSIDKPQTLEFLKNLANGGAFIDVNPIYDSTDLVRCKYSLNTTYNGPIPTHQLKLPISIPQAIPVSVNK